MKIKGESTSVKVLPLDPFATFNVAVLIHSFVHIGCALLFILLTKPSMTTLPSSSSKVKHEYYRVEVITLKMLRSPP
jgi:hypothetical protein